MLKIISWNSNNNLTLFKLSQLSFLCFYVFQDRMIPEYWVSFTFMTPNEPRGLGTF